MALFSEEDTRVRNAAIAAKRAALVRQRKRARSEFFSTLPGLVDRLRKQLVDSYRSGDKVEAVLLHFYQDILDAEMKSDAGQQKVRAAILKKLKAETGESNFNVHLVPVFEYEAHALRITLAAQLGP